MGASLPVGESKRSMIGKQASIPKMVENKLVIIQNRCLCIVSGAFISYANPSFGSRNIYSAHIITLEKPTDQSTVQDAHKWTIKFIAKACQKMTEKLKNRTGPTRKPVATPGQLKSEWAENLMGKPATVSPIPPKPPWMDSSTEQQEQLDSRKKLKREYELQARKHTATEWDSIWTEYQRRSGRNHTVAQSLPLSHKRPWIHVSLAKAESSLATQIRTEKIGLADFLYRQRVPGITSPECPYG